MGSMLRHVYFIYYLLSLAVGAVGVVLAFVRWKSTKEPIAKHYFLFLSSIFFSISAMTVSAYLPTEGYAVWHSVINIINLFGLSMCTIFIPRYFSQFMKPELKNQTVKTVNTVFLIASVFLINCIIAFNSNRIGAIFVIALFALFVLAILYSLACFFALSPKYPTRVSSEDGMLYWVNLTKKLFVLSFFFFPLILLNDFSGNVLFFNIELQLPKFTPLMFLLWNGYSVFLEIGRLSSTGVTRSKPIEPAWDRYHLTKREKEVAGLLITGLSYSEIGETLFISAGTAKTHILNIYKKTETKNKLQLLQLVSKA
jgi:DNA-binding CsgD family transcriptional regulator